jgi:hypothetical protein
LTGFSCVDTALKGAREITCFRELKASVLTDYKTNFESVYSHQLDRYLAAAKQCSVTNHDATAVPNSLFPMILNPIATPQFGYVVGIGKGRVTSSRAYHGFAKLDPALGSSWGAIDVVDIINVPGATLGDQSLPQETGPPLTVSISRMPEVESQIATNMRRTYGVAAHARAQVFDFQYNGSKSIPLTQKTNDLGRWQDGVADILERSDYEEYTDEELETAGVTRADLRERMVSHLDFGTRTIANKQIGNKIYILHRDDRGDCGHVADVIVYLPEPNVKADYGQLALILSSFGHCSSDPAPELIEKATSYIRNEVSSR